MMEGLKRDERMEHTALKPRLGEFGEEVLRGIHPRRRGRREVERETRVAGEPFDDFGVFVGGVVDPRSRG